MARNKITISLNQKKVLLGILFVTCILCLSFYAHIVFFATFINWYTLTVDKEMFNNHTLSRINAFVLPTIFYFLSYVIQLVLIFLKPSKTKFVFSIISYVSTIILFVYLISYSVVMAQFLPYDTMNEFIGIALWSFSYILFLLLIVFNFSLMIFITHVKVQDEVKNNTSETIIKTKFGKVYLTIFILFAALTLLYFGSTNVYRHIFEDFSKGSGLDEGEIDVIYHFVFNFKIVFDVVLITGIAFQIVSIIDAHKKKLGLISYILEIVGFTPSIIYTSLNLFMMFRIGTSKEVIIVSLVFYSLTLILFIVNIVFCLVMRNKQKAFKTKEIKFSEI